MTGTVLVAPLLKMRIISIANSNAVCHHCLNGQLKQAIGFPQTAHRAGRERVACLKVGSQSNRFILLIV